VRVLAQRDATPDCAQGCVKSSMRRSLCGCNLKKKLYGLLLPRLALETFTIFSKKVFPGARTELEVKLAKRFLAQYRGFGM